jgi:hypothetical protein
VGYRDDSDSLFLCSPDSPGKTAAGESGNC